MRDVERDSIIREAVRRAHLGLSGGGGAVIAVPLASSTTSGTVKTDVNNPDPVVYLATSVDALLTILDAAKEDVGKISESSGPTVLAVGAVADGQYLKRSGATVVGALPALARSIVTVTTAVLADGATENGTIAIGKSFIINKVQTDIDARVRLYPTAAFRTADAARAVGTDPTGENGVLLDVLLESTYLEFSLAPPAAGYNDDGPVTNTIYYAIENVSGGAATVTLTLDVTILVS